MAQNNEIPTLAKVTIGRYDVSEGSSGRFCIEVEFPGEPSLIVSEEDPVASLESPDDTFVTPDLSDEVYDVLEKSGLATYLGGEYCDPNQNGGFSCAVYRVKAGEGTFIVRTDYGVTAE